MIKFNPEKLTFEYVYIRKIFKNFVEVIVDNERNRYESDSVSYKRLKDGSVQIPIHYRVFSLYLKTNSILHFDETVGKKACITYYDGKVLSIDVYRRSYLSGYEPEETWKSVNEGAFAHVKEMLKVQEDIFIDGESIFLMDKLGQRETFKGTNAFWIQPVRYISLSKMGIKKSTSKLLSDMDKKEVKPEEKAKIEEEIKKDNDATILLKSGHVLAYNPNADIDPQDFSIVVYSPVFANNKTATTIPKRTSRFSSPENDQASFFKNLKNIEDVKNPTILNLNFVLKATKVIGEHYSFEDTDFLNVPKIILETNIINLKSDISLSSRSTYPVDIPVWDGLAYIMRYCYSEDNLNVYRDLVSLFKFTLTKGFVSQKQTGNLFLDGKNMGDIKHFKVRLSNPNKKDEKPAEMV
jgi:hypothetical protein